ncbi:MAG: sigma 54-interacting transcriptional regulator [Candidatus Eremiobacterota bacterium]
MDINILIVEDEKILAMTMKKMLISLGYKVVGTVSSGEKALQKISEEKPSLVLMDVRLKGPINGIEVAEKLTGFYNIPVIYITAYEDKETFERAKLTAPFGYIIKPFDEKILHMTIEIALYKHRLDINMKEQAINKEKEKYRSNVETIFSCLEEGIITVDKDMNITEINPSIEKIFGFSRDIIGKSFSYFIKGPMFINILNETLIKKKPVKINRIEVKDSKILTINTAPLIDPDGICSGVIMVIRDETHVVELEKKLEVRQSFHNITGESEKIQKIYSLIESLYSVQTTVLITGESGTGKELVAEAIHYKGGRKSKPFVRVNCSSLSENLLESELFGHVRGSFTGAFRDKIGRFEMAHGGTIFLDEIGDISPSMQLHLLRVLENHEFERVGDNKTIKVDVLIIAATNQDLKEKVRTGTFREDLYYRLKVIEIKLPPLRERKEDIPLLILHFLRKFNNKFNKHITHISEEVERLFMKYNWPGNIRELEHALEHACILCRNSLILPEDLPEDFRDMLNGNEENNWDNRDMIIETLVKSEGNKCRASRMLGISRQTLYRRIKEYNINYDM